MAVQHTVQSTWTADGAGRTERAVARPARWAPRALRPMFDLALYPVQLALAALFVLAGAAALNGAPAVLEQFGTIDNATGLGAWFRVTAGILELLGALLLCVRAAAGVGAVLLGAVMAGAVLAHVLVLHTTPVAPAALGAVLALVAYAHRDALAVAAAHLERNL